MAFYPRVVVALTDSTLSLHHLYRLRYCSFPPFPLNAKLIIDWLGYPCRLQFSMSHFMLRVVDLYDVTGTIFESKNKTRFSVFNCEVFFSDYVLHSCWAATTIHARIATFVTFSVWKEIVADYEHLQGVWPVVNWNIVLGVKLVDFHGRIY